MKKLIIIQSVFFISLMTWGIKNYTHEGNPCHGETVSDAYKMQQLSHAQQSLVKQAFLSIKPCDQSVAQANESLAKFVHDEGKNEFLIETRKLFHKRASYLKALSSQAESEKYLAFAALLGSKLDEESTIYLLRKIIHYSDKKIKLSYMLYPVFFAAGGLFTTAAFHWA